MLPVFQMCESTSFRLDIQRDAFLNKTAVLGKKGKCQSVLGLTSQWLEGELTFSKEFGLRLHEGKPQGAKFPFSSGGVFF